MPGFAQEASQGQGLFSGTATELENGHSRRDGQQLKTPSIQIQRAKLVMRSHAFGESRRVRIEFS
jgi:hypothetical protein